jgi:type IV pilus assembly protein PilE
MKVKGMKQAGFSLVELMVVVGIIGILAAIAVPKLQKFTAKAKQSEIKAMLNNAYTLQEAKFAEDSVYSGTLTGLGMTLTSKNYTMTDAVTLGTGTFTANGNLTAGKQLCGGINTDPWSINQAGALTGNTNPNCN